LGPEELFIGQGTGSGSTGNCALEISIGQAAQVTALRFNKVPVLESEAGKIRKSYKEKKKRLCLCIKQSSKRRHILFYSEND
jgi:hypothetical protein